MINEKGSLIAKYSYDEFGISDPGSKFDNYAHHGNVYGFTGEQWDEDVGLLYLRARYYMPEVGRFITKDPLPGYIENPQSLHSYVYCENNPVNLVDLEGFCPVSQVERRTRNYRVARERSASLGAQRALEERERRRAQLNRTRMDGRWVKDIVKSLSPPARFAYGGVVLAITGGLIVAATPFFWVGFGLVIAGAVVVTGVAAYEIHRTYRRRRR